MHTHTYKSLPHSTVIVKSQKAVKSQLGHFLSSLAEIFFNGLRRLFDSHKGGAFQNKAACGSQIRRRLLHEENRSAAAVAVAAAVVAAAGAPAVAAAAEQEEQNNQNDNPAAVVVTFASTVHKSSTPLDECSIRRPDRRIVGGGIDAAS